MEVVNINSYTNKLVEVPKDIRAGIAVKYGSVFGLIIYNINL